MPLPTVSVVKMSATRRAQGPGLRSSSQRAQLPRHHVSEDIAGPQAVQTHVSHPRATGKKPPRGSATAERVVSRIELLLAPQRPERVYSPRQESTLAADLNRAIKAASQWTDVKTAIEAAPELSASNISYALYRLGCLQSFASKYRQNELAKSGLLSYLSEEAQHKLHEMDAGSVTLLLDGCARLDLALSASLLEATATLAHKFAPVFEASQLPLVLWAFSRFNFVPRGSILSALDQSTCRLAQSMTSQNIAVALSSFQALAHLPSRATLGQLAEAVHRQLPKFKPTELATCIEAFAAFAFPVPAELLTAVAERSGRPVHSNIVSGKAWLGREPALGQNGPVRGAKTTVAASTPASAAAPIRALAGQVLDQVSLRVGELESPQLGGQLFGGMRTPAV